MIRIVVKTWNRRTLQANGSEVQSIQSFDVDSQELESWLRDSDDGWQHHYVIGAELLDDREELWAMATRSPDVGNVAKLVTTF